MKLLNSEQIKWLDKYTIEHEPIASIDLMERAATKFFDELCNLTILNNVQNVFVFCGEGNNGGDGLAIARMLVDIRKKVSCFLLAEPTQLSKDCATNKTRFEKFKKVKSIRSEKDFPAISPNDLVIDALFGSGLNRPLQGLAAALVTHINNSKATIYAVDIPSGLYADKMLEAGSLAIKANMTFTFNAPKLVFMLPDYEQYIGKWKVLDIGLSKEGEQQLETNYHFTTENDLQFLKREESHFAHKGTYGHALIAAGSYSMMGAAVLCTKAALRSGCGLVSVAIPESGYTVMQTAVPEAMIALAENEMVICCPEDISKYKAVAIGCGIGTSILAKDVLEQFIHLEPKQLILDADALNIISMLKTLLKLLPAETIITPHPGEFKRLAGAWANDFEKLGLLKKFSMQHKLIVVLKGAHTVIALPDGTLHFNSTGNIGMAKGGSGDVLSGVIVSLLAQGFSAPQAAVGGVFVHGMAGDLALQNKGRYGMCASDIIGELPDAFKRLTM